MKIPFDSLAVRCIVSEIEPFVGAKLQKVHQPDTVTLGLELYGVTGRGYLVLSCQPEFPRLYFSTVSLRNHPAQYSLCTALRAHAEGGRLRSVRQVNSDRIVQLVFETREGDYTLVAELMGTRSNLIVLDSRQKIVTASRMVRGARPVQPQQPYQLPPPPPGDGLSPFLRKLVEATEIDPRKTSFHPVLVSGHGAYPVSVEALGYSEIPKPSFSVALEQYYREAIPAAEADGLKVGLIAQVKRVQLAREVAAQDLRHSLGELEKTSRWQLFGELILAHSYAIKEGQALLETVDYEGNELEISIDPELSPLENANDFFAKAKKAKRGAQQKREHLVRLEEELLDLQSFLLRLEPETRLKGIQEMHEEAKTRRWLHEQALPIAKKEDRPYAGHRIKELTAPSGHKLLYGENAESNDYLTMRLGKPNDYWLHVRGSTSAHVLIQTQNRPEKVSHETLQFAALVAVQHSTSKHAGYVPVDYTLKKYVRKPKGSPKGTASYTHEKTLHVENS